MTLEPSEIRDFYEGSYSHTGAVDDWMRCWRDLGARTKADHICQFLKLIPAPRNLIEVGCGDGAVLAELHRRGVGGTLTGIDISSAAIQKAQTRPEITAARVFDGSRIDAVDRAYDVAFCTHVLEHLPEPLSLLTEITRIARAVVIEVPLERNLLAGRKAARALSDQSGHLQRFDRASIRDLIADTGWQVREELLDPLPLAVHTIRADSRPTLAMAYTKWAVRSLLAALPSIGERVMTLHYAVLATPPG